MFGIMIVKPLTSETFFCIWLVFSEKVSGHKSDSCITKSVRDRNTPSASLKAQGAGCILLKWSAFLFLKSGVVFLYATCVLNTSRAKKKNASDAEHCWQQRCGELWLHPPASTVFRCSAFHLSCCKLLVVQHGEHRANNVLALKNRRVAPRWFYTVRLCFGKTPIKRVRVSFKSAICQKFNWKRSKL